MQLCRLGIGFNSILCQPREAQTRLARRTASLVNPARQSNSQHLKLMLYIGEQDSQRLATILGFLWLAAEVSERHAEPPDKSQAMVPACRHSGDGRHDMVPCLNILASPQIETYLFRFRVSMSGFGTRQRAARAL